MYNYGWGCFNDLCDLFLPLFVYPWSLCSLIYLYCLYFILILCWFWTSFNMFRWKSKLSYWKCFDTFWRKFEDLSHTCIYLFTLSAFPVFVKVVGLNLNSSINLHSEPSFDWWVRHAPNGYLTYNLTLYIF